MSITIQIRNGTPIGNEPLCDTCLHGHVQRGFRSTEELTHCTCNMEVRLVPFPVRECNDYSDRRIPAISRMEEIATDLATRQVASLRPAGFALPNGVDSECED